MANNTGNGNGYQIALFTLALGMMTVIFQVQISSFGDLIDDFDEKFILLLSLEKERNDLLDGHQKESVREMDIKLQQEISAAQKIVEARFTEADEASENRHNDQGAFFVGQIAALQKQLDRIAGYFKAPKLKNNDSS